MTNNAMTAEEWARKANTITVSRLHPRTLEIVLSHRDRFETALRRIQMGVRREVRGARLAGRTPGDIQMSELVQADGRLFVVKLNGNIQIDDAGIDYKLTGNRYSFKGALAKTVMESVIGMTVKEAIGVDDESVITKAMYAGGYTHLTCDAELTEMEFDLSHLQPS